MLNAGWKRMLAGVTLLGVVMAALGIVSEASAGFPYQRPKAVDPNPKIVDPPPPPPPPPPVIKPPPCDPPPRVISETPEPATLTLAAIGAAGLVGYRRLRKRQ